MLTAPEPLHMLQNRLQVTAPNLLMYLLPKMFSPSNSYALTLSSKIHYFFFQTASPHTLLMQSYVSLAFLEYVHVNTLASLLTLVNALSSIFEDARKNISLPLHKSVKLIAQQMSILYS